MKLIITRPRADAEPLAEKLRALGHQPIMVPLLEIVPRADIVIPQRNYQALCLTSANGAIQIETLLNVPVLTVGPQSAAAASKAGYHNVTSHGGDVDGLVKHINANLRPANGPLLYLSGATTSGDLEGQLRHHGFDVDRIVTYDAVAIKPENLASILPSADAVLLYSPRSAQLWMAAIANAGVEHRASTLLHYCLSANVAKALPQSWPTRLAAIPTENAMLAALEPCGEQE